MLEEIAIHPWKQYSKSAASLAIAFSEIYDTEVVLFSDAKLKSKSTQWQLESVGKYMWVNWGAAYPAIPMINENSAEYSNKVKFFRKVDLLGNLYYVPKHFYTKKDAQSYLDNYTHSGDVCLVARELVNAHGGKGIVLVKGTDPLPDAPLYTQYIKKADEYRVHFFKHSFKNKTHFLFQKKKLLLSAPSTETTFSIRNLANGWVFSSKNFDLPEAVLECANDTLNDGLLDDLTFGAMDIVYNKAKNIAYLLEVNTAPGLSLPTAAWYAEHIYTLANSEGNYAV